MFAYFLGDLPALLFSCAEAIGRRVEDNEHPQIGALQPELADDPGRLLPLTGYPYLIIYKSEDVPPLIVRVLHGARDLPGLFGDGRPG